MTILITLLIVAVIYAVLSTFSTAYLYGLNQIKTKMLVESKRREKRLDINLRTWQNAYVRKTGASLKPQPPKESEDQQKGRRIVSPSEVIAEMKQPTIRTSAVPKAIQEEFLTKTSKFVSTNTETTVE